MIEGEELQLRGRWVESRHRLVDESEAISSKKMLIMAYTI